ncbi:Similar to Setd3: Actin-histidine N-methyltransferase (Mus musculus) [Cotesia congregata]|uniref:protein-histidine N-methyltransferase n=1 Tax=Cotesia congregata TaxID=51543 RepID=A0A8J2MS57_COTCN|nr:Similar to Setd3: Actin-histidine N-methyltransferase (Mus musculus) [Cotesia congregata]
MGRKKSHPSKCKQNTQPKKLSSTKKNEILIQCDKLLRLCSDPEYSTQLWENYLEITAVLEKVKRLEDMKISGTSKRSVAIEQFLKWLQENGANYEGTSIAEFPGYELGLKAGKNFSVNDLLLQIPGKIIFSCETAAPELAALQNDPLIQHMPQVALAIALLIERHKDNSKWKPYLNILPSNYCTVLYMTTNDMIELKGSPTLEAALKHCRNIARQYSYFNQLFNNNSNPVSELLREIFTYEEYCWAVSTVMTRQNIIPSKNGTQMIHALIPMWDMCNHEEGPITTDFNVNSDTCDCYAKRDFKTGDQIFINYGSRTNSDFFVHSGFVTENNKDDGFKLRLGISKSDPLCREKTLLLEKLGFSSTTMTFLLQDSSEPISEQMRAFLRIFSMRKSDLDHWIESDKILDLKHRDCSLDTVVEDNEDLNLLSTTMSPTKKMILQLRISEKKILKRTLEFIDQ